MSLQLDSRTLEDHSRCGRSDQYTDVGTTMSHELCILRLKVQSKARGVIDRVNTKVPGMFEVAAGSDWPKFGPEP